MELNWLDLIDKRAALREQFPTFARVRNERPGCAADIARQEFYRAENRMSVAREQEARWEAAVAVQARRREVLDRRAANAAYKARERRNEEVA
jgi:hypothetical protein